MRKSILFIVIICLCILASGCAKTQVSKAQKHINAAEFALKSGDSVKAADEFAKAVAISPRDPGIRLSIFMLYSQPKYRSEQIQAADELIKLLDSGTKLSNDKLTDMYSVIAVRLDLMGESTRAEHAYRRAYEVSPEEPGAANNLAYYYAVRNTNLDEAYKLANQACTDQPGDPASQDTMGWVLYRMGKYAEAQDYLKASVKRMPNDADCRYHLGAVYAAQGLKAEAAVEFRKALSLKPGHKESQNALKLSGLDKQ